MKEYIILVALSAIIAAVTDILAPKEWRGYVRIAVGFLILAVLISPLAKVKNIEIFNVDTGFSVSDVAIKDKVTEELIKNVEKDIEERALSEFKTDVKATAELEVDGEHKIKGVKKIVIKSGKVPDGLEARLKEVYGCENIEFRNK
ncbi:MAG: hypothetical protein IJ304_02415 [Clostridia bacterium]|nr:hypothetical protein [Clostridia bacterium]